MKILNHLLSDTFTIARFQTTSGFKQEYSTVTASVQGKAQPASGEKTNLFNGAMGKTFTVWMDSGIDVQEGDRLRDTSSNQIYVVKNGGVSARSQGPIDFKEIVVEEIN